MYISDILRAKGYEPTVPTKFYKKIDEWQQWYEGYIKEFHQYEVFNGQRRVKCERAQTNMAKQAAEDWANLLMNEKVKITLEGEAEQQFFDDVCRGNHFERKMSEYEEFTFALGTTAIVTRVTGITVTEDGEQDGAAEDIKLDYVLAKDIYPISWENGYITECAFGSVIYKDERKYYYLQIHKKNDSGEYDIDNYLYETTKGSMSEVNIETTKGFEHIASSVHTHSKDRLFVINTPNIANNYDTTIPMGMSCYGNAISQLKTVDTVYDSFNTEFTLGRKRVMVKPEALKDIDGNPAFDPNDLVFYVMPEDSQTGSVVQNIDSALRTADHNMAMQMALNTLSMKCGFGANHWLFDGGNITTATQVISQNSDMFRTLKKHEIVLESVLTELARIILRLGNQFMGMSLDEEVEISIDFDDSIIEDDATEFSRDMTMMQAGILNPYEFRMKWMNEDEETARAALPKLERLVSDVV